MKLFELFDTKARWEEDIHSENLIEYPVTVNDQFYIITFERVPVRTRLGWGLEDPTWLVEFSRPTGPGGSNPYGLTNTGNAPQILSVVVQAMKHFADEHKVGYFVFSASEESRQSLYQRMIKRLGTLVKTFAGTGGTRYIVKMGN